MAERGTEKMTEWLDIKLESLSSEERLCLIEEIFDSLTPQELRSIRDVAEKKSQSKLEDAKAALLPDFPGKCDIGRVPDDASLRAPLLHCEGLRIMV